jgi:hypothetical protein
MEVLIIGPEGGDSVQLGPVRIRILEDGSTTDHRLGVGEITLPPIPAGRPSTVMPVTTRASTWSRALGASR